MTATYNRSNVLRLAVESVRSSPFADWELLVVGDACTDDTAAVLEAFRDPRIRFINLPENHGEQSAPNNEGVRLARGRYIAFLNHDDLWTPDHLPVAIAELERSSAAFVHTLALAVPARLPPRIVGATHGTYEPWASVPASTWVFCRSAAERIGGWRDARSLHIFSSADWLHRAWKSGLSMRTIDEVTVVSIYSGDRQGSYAERQVSEHEWWAAGIRSGPQFMQGQVTAAAARMAVDDLRIVQHLFRAARNMLRRLAIAAGQHPSLPRLLAFGLRRGSVLNHLRRTRGLPPLSRKELHS